MSSSPKVSPVEASWPMASALYCDLDSHRAMLQSIIDHSPADICLKDPEGRYLLVNRNFGKRVGLDPALVVGKTGYDFFAKEEADRKTANDRLVLGDGKARQFEEVVTLEDGPHTLISEKFPVCNEAGKVTGICGICTDITHRKADEEKLHRLSNQVQQQGRTLETVLSASPNIVYMFDNHGRVVYANQAGAVRFNLRPVELMGKTWKALCQSHGLFDGFTERVARLFKTGETEQGFLSDPGPEEGQEFAYTMVPIMDVRGRVVNVIAYLNDVTRDRQKDRALEKRNLELQRSNEELESLAAIASRDLGEPLREIQQNLKQLRAELAGQDLSASGARIEAALAGAGRIELLIKELLKYSSIGEQAEPFRKIDLNRLLSRVEADMVSRFQETGARLSVMDLPEVWGRESLLYQLLQNLITNAVLHNQSQPPGIEVSVEKSGEFWIFEIKDNGVGIAARDFEAVFQLFKRLDNGTHQPGAGVGLAVCRKILALHGGEIWVRSLPGSGSSFFFSLPIRYKDGQQMTIDLFGDK